LQVQRSEERGACGLRVKNLLTLLSTLVPCRFGQAYVRPGVPLHRRLLVSQLAQDQAAVQGRAGVEGGLTPHTYRGPFSELVAHRITLGTIARQALAMKLTYP